MKKIATLLGFLCLAIGILACAPTPAGPKKIFVKDGSSLVIQRNTDGAWAGTCNQKFILIYWTAHKSPMPGLELATNEGFMNQGIMGFDVPTKPMEFFSVDKAGKIIEDPYWDKFKNTAFMKNYKGGVEGFKKDFAANTASVNFTTMLATRLTELKQLQSTYQVICQ